MVPHITGFRPINIYYLKKYIEFTLKMFGISKHRHSKMCPNAYKT